MMPKYMIIIYILILLVTPTLGRDFGTYGNPIPVGQTANLGDEWLITVLKVISNGEIIQSEDRYDNYQQYLVLIKAKNTGLDRSFEWGRLCSKGASDDYNLSQGEIQEAVVRSGSVITGTIGWLIKSSDSDRLRMYDSRCSNENNRTYFALYYSHENYGVNATP